MTDFVHKLLRGIQRVSQLIYTRPNIVIEPPLPNIFMFIVSRCVPSFYTKWRVSRLNYLVKTSRQNYARQFWRIRKKAKSGNRIKVMILAMEPAKWKMASFYELLEHDSRFDVVVGLVKPLVTVGKTPIENHKEYLGTINWYEQRGYKCVYLYRPLSDDVVDVSRFNPDIVFYTFSWYKEPKHLPSRLSSIALTFYMPYFVPNYVDVKLDCQLDIHRLYWRYIALNKDIAVLYSEATKDRTMSGRFVELGHTMIDQIVDANSNVQTPIKRCIIYAPHWTINHPNNNSLIKISTFVEYGLTILKYAKEHMEYDWVFKPHPSLYNSLVTTGYMTKDEVDCYYEEWKSIGRVCVDGDYAQLFAESCIMITDCGSFLSEYGVTGKPIIHLISSRNNLVPPKALANIYNTYYQVFSNKDLMNYLRIVVEEGLDPRKELRLLALKQAALFGEKSSTQILRYIERICAIDRKGSK